MSGPKVVLIGPMGSGKTTVATLLGERWGLPVRDTDADIVSTAGKPVSEIFVDDGEAAFRALEREAVATAVREHTGVLALGGGAVLAPETRAVLEGLPVVYLRVGLADAVKRVGLGAGRPLLLGGDGGLRARIRKLLEDRAPIYEAAATLVVDTDGKTPAEVADEIVEELA
ncbi:shikimate kinase [Nocardioides sp. Kera G14]|uniref:shikimate kinase n=1 Tax=Nocardioides sp. Kera G14 TaxID=2884264 RepID=UPI001D11B984|nr:shikimate kinase [Nocardioides sp. Kera G14]UDY22161.1 shikimate kinase [Nocardioides sp. Kera G14]